MFDSRTNMTSFPRGDVRLAGLLLIPNERENASSAFIYPKASDESIFLLPNPVSINFLSM